MGSVVGVGEGAGVASVYIERSHIAPAARVNVLPFTFPGISTEVYVPGIGAPITLHACGAIVGVAVGAGVGCFVGGAVGGAVGRAVGPDVGLPVGPVVGALVAGDVGAGAPPPPGVAVGPAGSVGPDTVPPPHAATATESASIAPSATGIFVLWYLVT